MITDFDRKLILNQCRESLELIEKLETFSEQLNFEKEVKDFFKKRKYLGSRDRRFIKNQVYSFYKWRGFLDVFGSLDLLYVSSILDNTLTEKLYHFSTCI